MSTNLTAEDIKWFRDRGVDPGRLPGRREPTLTLPKSGLTPEDLEWFKTRGVDPTVLPGLREPSLILPNESNESPSANERNETTLGEPQARLTDEDLAWFKGRGVASVKQLEPSRFQQFLQGARVGLGLGAPGVELPGQRYPAAGIERNVTSAAVPPPPAPGRDPGAAAIPSPPPPGGVGQPPPGRFAQFLKGAGRELLSNPPILPGVNLRQLMEGMDEASKPFQAAVNWMRPALAMTPFSAYAEQRPVALPPEGSTYEKLIAQERGQSLLSQSVAGALLGPENLVPGIGFTSLPRRALRPAAEAASAAARAARPAERLRAPLPDILDEAGMAAPEAPVAQAAAESLPRAGHGGELFPESATSATRAPLADPAQLQAQAARREEVARGQTELPQTPLAAERTHPEARPGHRYRAFDRPNEALGADRSSASKPFGYGGAYEIEARSRGGTALGPAHPGEVRGPIEAGDVSRVFYDPDYWSPEFRAERLEADLPELRRMFPKAELVEISRRGANPDIPELVGGRIADPSVPTDPAYQEFVRRIESGPPMTYGEELGLKIKILDELTPEQRTLKMRAGEYTRPDQLYRPLLSTGSRRPLRKGETWRGRALSFVESALKQHPPETPAKAGPVPGTPGIDTGIAQGPAPTAEGPPSDLVSRARALFGPGERPTPERIERALGIDSTEAGRLADILLTQDEVNAGMSQLRRAGQLSPLPSAAAASERTPLAAAGERLAMAQEELTVARSPGAGQMAPKFGSPERAEWDAARRQLTAQGQTLPLNKAQRVKAARESVARADAEVQRLTLEDTLAKEVAEVADLTPPPEAGGLAPVAGGQAGKALITDPLPFDDQIKIAFAPNNARRLGQRLARFPVLREALSIGNPSLIADSPVKQATIVRSQMMDEGINKIGSAMSYPRALGTQDDLFGPTDAKGLLTSGPAKGHSVNELAENSSLWSGKLPAPAREWLDRMGDIERSVLDQYKRNDIEINEVPTGEIERYAGRITMMKVTPSGEMIEAAFVGAGGRPLLGKTGAEKMRVYTTVAEGQKDGFVYMPYQDAVQLKAKAAWRRIVDKRVADWIVKNLPEDVQVNPQQFGATAKFAEYRNPSFPGQVFTGSGAKEFSEDIAQLLKRREVNTFFRGVNNLNSLQRIFALAGDASPFMIQLLMANFRHPGASFRSADAFARTLVMGFTNPAAARRYQNKILAQNADLLQRLPIITSQSGLEFTEALAEGGMLHSSRGLFGKSKLGQAGLKLATWPLRPFQMAYETAIDTAGVHLARGMEHLAGGDPAKLTQLKDYIDNMRGLASSARVGVGPNQAAGEAALLLAPRYRRAVAALHMDLVQGGLRGDLAKQAYASLAAGLVFSYVGISLAVGAAQKKPWEQIRRDLLNGLRPDKGDFLLWRIGNNFIGPGSKYVSDLKMIGKMVTRPDDFLDFKEVTQNPGVRWVWSQSAAAPKTSWEYLMGEAYLGEPISRDFSGDPVKSVLDFGRRVLGGNLLPIWVQGMVFEGGAPQERLARGGPDFFGLRAWPQPAKETALRFEKERRLPPKNTPLDTLKAGWHQAGESNLASQEAKDAWLEYEPEPSAERKLLLGNYPQRVQAEVQATEKARTDRRKALATAFPQLDVALLEEKWAARPKQSYTPQTAQGRKRLAELRAEKGYVGPTGTSATGGTTTDDDHIKRNLDWMRRQ